jgi:hypothetical protein
VKLRDGLTVLHCDPSRIFAAVLPRFVLVLAGRALFTLFLPLFVLILAGRALLAGCIPSFMGVECPGVALVATRFALFIEVLSYGTNAAA